MAEQRPHPAGGVRSGSARRIIAFDVNETLLDLSVLDPLFHTLLGDAVLRSEWFMQTLQVSFVGAITDRYVDFGNAQRSALAMVADRHGVSVDEDGARRVSEQMRSLPPHDDVLDALGRLRAAGLSLAALTNSPLEAAQAQLDHAGLRESFDAVLSADDVRAIKPRREPYELVARTFDAAPGDVRLVAAHAWDVAGALAAGCRAAFVARPGKVLDPHAERPDIVGDDLEEVTDRILAAGG